MEALSPKAQAVAHLFAGNTSPLAKDIGMSRALAQLKVRAATATKTRAETRYFQGAHCALDVRARLNGWLADLPNACGRASLKRCGCTCMVLRVAQ